MNASIDEIAVIRARLPYIDRRALSEAWFSALHLASDVSFSEATREHAPPGTGLRSAPLRSLPAERSSGNEVAVLFPARAATQRVDAKVVPLELRANVPVRRSLPTIAGATPMRRREVQATLTLMIANARVALHVRSDGSKMSAIVLCSARHVELVRRALAATVLALELRGTRVEAEVRTLEREEA